MSASEPSPPEPRIGPPRWVAIAGLGISAAAVTGVIVWALRQPAPSLPSGRDEVGALLVALLGVVVAVLLRSERWVRLVGYAGGSLRRGDSLGITIVAFMGNTLLPVRGGDVFRVLLARPRARLGARPLIGTLVAERVLDVLLLGIVFVVLGYGVLRGVDTPDSRPLLALGLGLGLAGLAGLALWRIRDRREWAGKLVAFLEPMATSTLNLVSRHGLAMFVLTVLIWATDAGVWFACARSVGLEISAVEALYLLSLTAIFVLVPSGPGFAGTFDAGVLFGARALGGSGQVAVSYLIVLRFVLFVPLTIVGVLLVLFRYGGPALIRSAWRRRALA